MAGCAATLGIAAEYARAAGDINYPTCSPATEASPGFRAFLPDCRAYEMVSPPYTGGSAVATLDNHQVISADGEHLIARSFGGFAGTENNEHANGLFNAGIYLFTRTSSGWATEALAPPATQVSHSEFMAANASFDATLWGLDVQPGTNEELLAYREVPYILSIRALTNEGTPHFVPVGPEQPGVGHEFFQFAGASDNLGHIVFELVGGSGRKLWPGDTTLRGAASLYEYVGTANREPRLVGVKNDGPLVGASAVNENAELISKCGTEIGGGETGSAYNAVSADGSIIYFTAMHENAARAETCVSPPVNEVYARINGSSTVAISRYKSPDCTGSCASAAPMPGVFAGASRDGSKMFFTTAQPLLNSDTDTSSDVYMAEVNAAGVQNLVDVSHGDASDPTPGSGANAVGIARISPDGSHVYFVARGVLTRTPNDLGEAAEDGAFNLYEYDVAEGATAFVASLASSGELTREVEGECAVQQGGGFERECEEGVLTNEESRVGVPQSDNRPFETTADGRYLVFVSARRLTAPEDTSTAVQAFEYDAQQKTLVRVSVGQKSTAFPSGYNDDGNTTTGEDFASIRVPSYARQDLPASETSALSVAEDGTVFFTSRDALAPFAVEGTKNVYEYHEGNVYLISAGEDRTLEESVFGGAGEPGNENSGRLLGTNRAGTEVFFSATGALTPSDTDTQASWYAARMNGGFPAPASSVECAGEGCQGPPGPMPALPSAGSLSLLGSGNLAPPAPLKDVVKAKPLTRAQKLAKALMACRIKHDKRKRSTCKKIARKKYGRGK